MTIATLYTPGQRVPVSGIYNVIHNGTPASHHPQHQVTCVEGTPFPPCRICGKGVVFALHEETEHLKAHAPMAHDHEMFSLNGKSGSGKY